jgi:hypothetical protein
MDHAAFSLDLTFYTAAGAWRCTDIGTRTIVAVFLDAPHVREDPSWLDGPPYAVAERVFDENDLQGCFPTPLEPEEAQKAALADLERLHLERVPPDPLGPHWFDV